MTLNTNGREYISGAIVKTVLSNFSFVLEACKNGPPFSHNLGRYPDTSQICHCHYLSPGHIISTQPPPVFLAFPLLSSSSFST